MRRILNKEKGDEQCKSKRDGGSRDSQWVQQEERFLSQSEYIP